MQRLVLSMLTREPRGLSEVAWTLAERENHVEQTGELAPGIRIGKIQSPFYKSFNRAVHALRTERRLEITKRKLRTAEDLVAHYPFKTLRLETRDLRSCLLAPILDIASRRRRVSSAADMEQQLLERPKLGKPDWLGDWFPIRTLIAQRLAVTTDSHEFDQLLQLLARGQDFFDPQSSVTSIGIHKMNGDVATTGLAHLIQESEVLLSQTAVHALKSIYRRAIPRDRHEHRLLKDILFRVGEFRRDRRTGLHQETKEELLRLMPTIVEALPGFARASKSRPTSWDRPSGPKFGPHINLVLDRHALDPFSFVTAA